MRGADCFKIFIIGLIGILLCPGLAAAKKLVALKVYPEHVGVFAQVGTQQFTAIAVFDDGSRADYTEKVGWSIVPYPFANQDLKPHEVAKIDQKGLATVLSSWGRVRVRATYPPPVAASNSVSSSILRLLLNPLPFTVNPDNGPLKGTNTVTITSTERVLCTSDVDLVNVKLAGIPASNRRCLDGGRRILVTAGNASAAAGVPGPIRGEVLINSISQGIVSRASAYTYNRTPTVDTVLPGSGPMAGGNEVTVRGNFGGGSGDITEVRIGGRNAAIVRQQVGIVVAKVPPRETAGPVRVTVVSTSHGTSSLENGYIYTGKITSVVPASGPQVGGNQVLISGHFLCGGASSCDVNDIVRVALKGVDARVDTATRDAIVVTARPSPEPGTGRVVVISKTYGPIVSEVTERYTFNPKGMISGVTPGQGPTGGGTVVVIEGQNLHNGSVSDIAGVRFNQNDAAIQSVAGDGSSVTVVTGASGSPGTGPVVVNSRSHGVTILSDGFTYIDVSP